MGDDRRRSGSRTVVLRPATSWSGVLLNDVADNAGFPYELGGYVIDRANDREVDLIKSKFDLMIQLIGHPSYPPYEATIRVDSGQVEFSYDVPRESWRYTVVRRTSEDAAQGPRKSIKRCVYRATTYGSSVGCLSSVCDFYFLRRSQNGPDVVRRLRSCQSR